MLFQRKTTILLLSILIVGISPSLVLSLASDSPLYQYITGGQERLDRERRDDWRSKPASDELLSTALAQADDSLRHLAHYESILHGRHLAPADGSPGHVATISSWPEDNALSIARNSYFTSKASYLLSYQLCMRYGKPAGFCGVQLTKLYKTPVPVEKCHEQKYRTFNGSCNNPMHRSWGSAFTAYSRLLPPAYKDGIWEPRERGMLARFANAVEISEGVQKSSGKLLKDTTLTTVSWAGLVAYDLSHTVSNRMFSNGDPISCCENDRWVLAPRHRHPLCMPIIDRNETKCYNYVRSMIAPSQDYRFGPAQQMNGASHFLDGSGIYGITEEVSKSLRTGEKGQIDAKGKTKSPSQLSSSSSLPFTGEMRLNSDVISAVVHMVLINEHNRLADGLSKVNPGWDDEKLYQEARRILIAELQHITYSEWLPVILGDKEVNKQGLMLPKSGHHAKIYNPSIAPSVYNSFANAAMRFTGTLLDEQLHLYDEDRNPSGNMSLHFSLIEPKLLSDDNQLASLIRSLSTQNCQSSDLYFPQAVTKYLYSQPNGSGYDALSMDIQRGRDHGLPTYVAFRKLYGFPHGNFDQLSSTIRPEVVSKLKKAYEKVGSIDLIVGGLAETPTRGSLLGPVFTNIIAQQMSITRTADRYFYDNQDQPYPFTKDQLKEIQQVKLARLICDNTLVKKMQPNAFKKPNIPGNKLVDCSDETSLPRINLNLWKEDSSS